MATLFALKKEGVNAVQSLMRHADPRITMELYAQGEEDSMREAQKHLTGLFLVDLKAIAVPGMVYLGTHPSSQYEHQ